MRLSASGSVTCGSVGASGDASLGSLDSAARRPSAGMILSAGVSK